VSFPARRRDMPTGGMPGAVDIIDRAGRKLGDVGIRGGTIRVIVGTDPAPGVEISETVPAGKIWRLRAFHFTFVTDATAVNRVVNIVIDNGVNPYVSMVGEVHGASVTRAYSLSLGGHQRVTGLVHERLLPDILMLPGHRIRTTTSNMQPGDNYSAPIMQVEEFPA
jgi:hypothetical protein